MYQYLKSAAKRMHEKNLGDCYMPGPEFQMCEGLHLLAMLILMDSLGCYFCLNLFYFFALYFNCLLLRVTGLRCIQIELINNFLPIK